MNVLIVGAGKGSWTIRGEQLGAAMGARVTSAPAQADWRWADLVVLVKRGGAKHAAAAHAANVPIVWDALDFWAQPQQNGYSAREARAVFDRQRAEIRPARTIAATQSMAEVCDGVYLSHHSWVGLEPTPARERIRVVAYEGNVHFLGRWHRVLQDACAKRGWTFVVNPPDLRAVDLLVGFRDAEGGWDGFMCREWKSGVKIANAIAAGRPFVGQSTAALREIGPPSTVVESAGPPLDAAFDAWEPYVARATAVEACQALASHYTLPTIATQYAAILADARMSCAG
jgi:hypothetical protein